MAKKASANSSLAKTLETYMLTLPGAKLSIQWGADRVFKVGGKMFAAMGPQEHEGVAISFKTADDSFHLLTQMKGIIPAPYLARAKWVALEKFSALKPTEIKAYVTRAHAIVASGLPKKTQKELGLI